MNILAIAPSYPFPDHPFAGIFNKKCVDALKKQGICIEVLSPRPFVPRVLAHLPRCMNIQRSSLLK